jgi:hypothetical protein
MTDFEKLIQTLPEYQTLVFQHGERLFIKRDGEYEVLAVRLAYNIWSGVRQNNKDERHKISQEWFGRGRDSIMDCKHKFERGIIAPNSYVCNGCGLTLERGM